MSSRVCGQCGCSDIDTDPARGDAVCTGCGSVLEEHIIVSEVQFAENAGGASSVVGQFVSTDGTKSHNLGAGFHHGMGRESREITLQNGKKRIQALGGKLHLNQHCIETAFNFFKMAVSRRITRGRRSMLVAAACLYLVCRTEGTSHMLLDFADVLQESVYTLGKTYMSLSKELCIKIPPIEPYMYIERFANQLEFGERMMEVSNTALRLVARMKRDWMAQGRRPSGLCGAALLVAARIHDFNRTIKDIMKVVKIGEGTIRKRLLEFEQTPSSSLTIDEFTKIDLEEEMDPPCFTEGRKKAKIQLDDQGKLGELTAEIMELQKEIDQEIEILSQKKAGPYKKFATKDKTDSEVTVGLKTNGISEGDLEECNKFIEKETLKEILHKDKKKADTDNEASRDSNESPTNLNSVDTGEPSSRSSTPTIQSEAVGHLGMGINIGNSRPTVASMGLKTEEENMKYEEKDDEDDDEEDDEEKMKNCELDLTGLDDDELDLYILRPDEVTTKTRLWNRTNADYLKELKEKIERQLQEAEEKGTVKQEPKKKKRKKKNKEASTAREAMTKMLQEKKISNKINYDVLCNLNQVTKVEPKKEAKVEKNTENVSNLLGDGMLSAVPVNLPTEAQSSMNRFKRPGRERRNSIVKLEKSPQKGPARKRPKLEPTLPVTEVKPVLPTEPEIVVESGPVAYHPEDEGDLEDEDYEEDQHISAAQLMGHDEVDDDYGDGYYDDMD